MTCFPRNEQKKSIGYNDKDKISSYKTLYANVCSHLFFMIRYKVIRKDGDIMTDSITFIHAADLHLDSPFKGLKKLPADIFNDIKQSTFSALDQLVHHAIVKQVDFVLLVGDLFDN